MKNLILSFLVLLFMVSFSASAQTSDQPEILHDSITFDINNPHYAPEAPAVLSLEKLEAPTLYLLNKEKVELKDLSALDVNTIHSIRIIQDEKDIEARGYAAIRTLVLIETKEK